MNNSDRFHRLEELKKAAFKKYAWRLRKKSITPKEASEILEYKSDRYVRKLAQEGWLEKYTKGKMRVMRIVTISIIAFLELNMKKDGVSPELADDEIESTLMSFGLLR